MTVDNYYTSLAPFFYVSLMYLDTLLLFISIELVLTVYFVFLYVNHFSLFQLHRGPFAPCAHLIFYFIPFLILPGHLASLLLV